MANIQSRVDHVKQTYEKFFSGSLEGFLEIFEEDSILIEVDTLPYGGGATGPAAIRAMILKMIDSWEDIRFDIHEFTSGDRSVVALGTFSARSKPNGIAVRFPHAEVWEFDDQDRLVRLNPIYGDTKQVADAFMQVAPDGCA